MSLHGLPLLCWQHTTGFPVIAPILPWLSYDGSSSALPSTTWTAYKTVSLPVLCLLSCTLITIFNHFDICLLSQEAVLGRVISQVPTSAGHHRGKAPSLLRAWELRGVQGATQKYLYILTLALTVLIMTRACTVVQRTLMQGENSLRKGNCWDGMRFRPLAPTCLKLSQRT